MKVKKTLPVLLILLGAIASSPAAQPLGQLAGAAAAADGEGSVFMLAGNDAFRTGASIRFNISSVSDFGLQLGLDRACGESFFGGGVDVKIVMLRGASRFPLDLALDASFGSLTSRAANRFLFDFGILASYRAASVAGRALEPYGSFLVGIEEIDMKRGSEAVAACLCPDDDKTDAGVFARAGIKIPVSDDGQLLIEASIDDPILLGAAFNIVF